nr:MAG TPA: YopX protein [Caudoviricetes sp.]
MISRFRAWDKINKEMVDADEIHWDNGQLDFIGDGITFMRKADEIELMQSTDFESDLEDELFEGDIILWTYWDEFEDEGRAVIVFENGMFKLLDTRTRKEVWDNLFDCVENCNVYLVGNIYANPELLEVNHDRD